MRTLPTVDLVANLAFSIINEDLSVSSFNEDNEAGNNNHQHADNQSRYGMHCPSSNKLKQTG